jgi:glycosyltransferase involved in cell wall biosynthesis
MKVVINLLEFNPGAMGGIETYVRNILNRLVNGSNQNSCTVICSESTADYFAAIDERIKLKVIVNRRKSFHRLTRSFVRKIAGIDMLARAIDQCGADVVHNPLTNVRPLDLVTPSVLTFYDMQHEYYPQLFSPNELQRRRAKYEKAVRMADRVIAISGHVKMSLVEKYGVDADKIDVVYLGCGTEYRLLDHDARSEEIKQKYALDRPYMYYPAATWPHKNHKNLLAALRNLKEQNSFDGELVLTGIAMQAHSEILEEIERLGLTGTVKVLGYLPYNELPYVYNMARLLVFPSLFEGFGIPLVEAMACGCPVVCSNVTSIPEVIGDAGVMFDPHSPSDIAEKILTVWNTREIRDTLRSKGLARAHMFNWDETARKTVEVYGRTSRGVQSALKDNC